MSAETGIAPNVLADHDITTLATLNKEIVDRRERESWGQTEELLAGIHMQLQHIRREQLALKGVERLPDFVPVLRPGQEPTPAPGPVRMSVADFARLAN